MKILYRWIKRAFVANDKLIEAEKREFQAIKRGERWKHQYLQLVEHNKWLQANVSSLCERLKVLEENKTGGEE